MQKLLLPLLLLVNSIGLGQTVCVCPAWASLLWEIPINPEGESPLQAGCASATFVGGMLRTQFVLLNAGTRRAGSSFDLNWSAFLQSRP